MNKLLWHSNAPWAPTGYGVQTSLIAPELAKHYDLVMSSFYGLEGGRLVWDGIPVWPGMGQDFGNTFLHHHAKRHFDGELRGGTVLTLLDVWVLRTEIAAQLDMACWVPVDHEPAPPRVIDWFTQTGAVPIAMTKFGQEQLEQFDALYCPHAVDIDTYRPRDNVRSKMNVPKDVFLIGMVSANKGRGPSRKGFQQALEAFKIFHESHDDAMLYLHTTMEGEWAEGEDLWKMLHVFEIPLSAVATADQYRMLWDPYSPTEMSHYYSAMDVLLHPAMGEGFGIPLLEAQACGTPCIATDFTAMPEVVGAGWHTAYKKFWTGFGSWQALADVEDLCVALSDCYAMSNSAREQLSAKARRHALQYAVPTVVEEHMLPALEAAQERFDDRRPIGLEPVAA